MTDERGPRHHRLRVMTWNLHGAARPDLADVAAAVAELDPHVLALQEVRRGQAAALARALEFPEQRWQLKHQALWPLGSRWAEGLAVLSRFPVRGVRSTVLPPRAPMRSHRRRVLQEVVVTVAGRLPVRVANTHLSSDDDADRSEQAAAVLARLAEPCAGAGTAHTVLVGDLNTDLAPDVIGRFVGAGLVDAGSGPTNPAGAVVQRLDHVLPGSGFVIESVTVPADGPEWAARSDHLPVVADLDLDLGAEPEQPDRAPGPVRRGD